MYQNGGSILFTFIAAYVLRAVSYTHLYEENVALTKKVVDYAHQFDVTVEGELGVLAGVEDEVSAEHHTYTCLLYTSRCV